MMSPLAISIPTRRPTFQVGDLVTVELFGGKVSGARVTRIEASDVFVSLCGLTVPEPYAIGDALALDPGKVIDW